MLWLCRFALRVPGISEYQKLPNKCIFILLCLISSIIPVRLSFRRANLAADIAIIPNPIVTDSESITVILAFGVNQFFTLQRGTISAAEFTGNMNRDYFIGFLGKFLVDFSKICRSRL